MVTIYIILNFDMFPWLPCIIPLLRKMLPWLPFMFPWLGWPYFFLCFPSPWPHKTGSVGRNKIKKNKNKKVYINVQSRQYAFTCRSIY